MSIPDIEMMLSLAQIMACQIREGKKIAIHCHAGLGRTGLAIVCYMIYEKRMGSDEAIQLVRKRRPGSVQNKKQTAFAQNFEKFVESLRVYYPPVCLPSPMALSDVLNNQSLYLFGGEQQKLKWVPKVVHLLVSKIKGSLVPGSDQDVLHHFARFDPSDYQKNLEFIEIQVLVMITLNL